MQKVLKTSKQLISKLRITVDYSKDDFNIIDKDGGNIHYSIESASSAERFLLKILS